MRPISFAFFTASSDSAAAVAEMAGVMPVMWNHEPPAKVFAQSTSPGFASAMAAPARS